MTLSDERISDKDVFDTGDGFIYCETSVKQTMDKIKAEKVYRGVKK